MDKEILNSPIFGPCEHLDPDQDYVLCAIAAKNPVRLFQELNKRLNTINLCLKIATMDEPK